MTGVTQIRAVRRLSPQRPTWCLVNWSPRRSATSNAAASAGDGNDSGSEDDLFVDVLSDEPVADDDWLS